MTKQQANSRLRGFWDKSHARPSKAVSRPDLVAEANASVEPVDTTAAIEFEESIEEGADFTVADHGSVSIVTPLTAAARAWIDNNVDPNAPAWGSGIAVEARYVDDIVDAMRGEGLVQS